jgi:hypothetical protein
VVAAKEGLITILIVRIEEKDTMIDNPKDDRNQKLEHSYAKGD